MKKKTVAVCLRDMQIGGVEAVLIQTLESLLARGDVNVRLITYVNITEPVYADWFAAHPQISITTLYPCRWLGTKMPHFFLGRLVKHLLRDMYRWFRFVTMNVRQFDDVDVFIDYYNFSFAREFKRFRGRKITWWHSSVDALYAQRAMDEIGGYDRLVMLTRAAADEVRKKYPRFAGKIVQMYNPVDVVRIRRMAAAGAHSDGDYFCCVARMSGDKDIETVLRAFDLFCRDTKNSDTRLVLVGDGNRAGHFKSIAAGLAVCDRIEFVGATGNPFGYMAHARAHILSSHSEGLGVVLIEAAAVGTLNIASDCRNGPREILMDGAAGMLYAPGDAPALAECMARAVADKRAVSKMLGVAARGLSRFDAAAIAGQIMDVIGKK